MNLRVASDPVPEENRLVQGLRDIPDSPLRSRLVLLLDELLAFAAEPRCHEMQGDGVPCGSLLASCDGCRTCVGLIEALRERLRAG